MRLLDEEEYEFLATNGGKTLFPWGDSPPAELPCRDISAAAMDAARDLLSSDDSEDLHCLLLAITNNLAALSLEFLDYTLFNTCREWVGTLLTHVEEDILAAIPYPTLVSKVKAYAANPDSFIISCDETHKGNLIKVNLPKLDIEGARNLEALPWFELGIDEYSVPEYGELT